MHIDAAQHAALEELCRAVDVANTKPKPEAIGSAVDRGVNEPQRWIGALQPKADNNG